MKKTKPDSAADPEEFGLPPDWTPELTFPGIVVSSRARVARNLARIPFPDRLTPDGRRTLCKALFRHVEEAGDKRWTLQNLDGAPAETLLCLEEASLVTPEFVSRDGGIGLMLFDTSGSEAPFWSAKRRRGRSAAPGGAVASAMVNEEDHLRFQCIVPGGGIGDAYWWVYEMESTLDGAVAEYAYDPTYGYLTSCPSNLGTGLRVGMMLHLIGLCLAGDLEKTLNGLDRLGLEARGLHGENSVDAPGCLYQVSNAETLGESEEQILDRTNDILRDLARQEDWARIRLMERSPTVVEDYVCRGLAIGQSARLLQVDEAVGVYYAVLFGLEMGLLGGVSIPGSYTQSPPFLQPATSRREMQRDIDDNALAVLRADTVREFLKPIRVVC